MEVKIFWQPGCPACPPAKELGKKLEEEGKVVRYFNVKEVEGLTEAAMHGLMSTPSIVIIKKGKEIKSWTGKLPAWKEILEVLNG